MEIAESFELSVYTYFHQTTRRRVPHDSSLL